MAEVDVGAVAPVAPVVPASTDAPASESTAEPIVESPEGGEPDKPERTFTQRELDDIVQRRLAKESKRGERLGEERARREAAERELERVRAERNPPQQQPRSGEPQQKDFTDYEEWILAKAEWRFDQKQIARQEASQRETATQQQQRQFAERARHVQQNLVAKGTAKFGEEFTEVVMGDLPITEVMVAAATRLPGGADVLFDLAKNHPDELIRISNLPDIEQAWEIKALESKLTAAPAPTRTPAPIVPNSGRASVEKRLEDTTTQEEFNAIRRRQIAARKGSWK